MKIYTKTGDKGLTGLFGGPRVSKDHARIEAYGTVDELSSTLGLARAETLPAEIDRLVAHIQNDLFSVGAELATPEPASHGTDWIGPQQIALLEQAIDQHEATLEPLKQFILPGGTKPAAQLHVARTVCRRAERRLVTLGRESADPIRSDILVYLNRLGDLLFVLARAVNQASGCGDVPWQKPDASRECSG